MAAPRWRQIADDLREQIDSGELKRGAQLPTELELQEAHEASRNTVRDAVKWLATLGLVESQPGRGTFVVDEIDPLVTTLTPDPETAFGGGEGPAYLSEVSRRGREPKATQPRVEIQTADEVVRAELRLAETAEVVSRSQQRFVDDKPYSLQSSYYPMELIERGARRLVQATEIIPGTVSYLEEKLGIKQVGYRDRITVRAPDEDEMRFFELPQTGVAVLETFRTAFDEDGKPIRLTVSVFPADRNQFVINVGDVPDEPSLAEEKGMEEPPEEKV